MHPNVKVKLLEIKLTPGDSPLMVHIDHLKPHLGGVPEQWRSSSSCSESTGVMSSSDHETGNDVLSGTEESTDAEPVPLHLLKPKP